MQSVPITTNVVSSKKNSTNKIDRHNITEILLKVVLKTITLAVTIVKSNSVSSVLSMYIP